MDDLVRLSASRVKCASECSWRYYCKYVLKIPDTSNDGARRGNVTHAVLEALLRRGKPRRELYVEQILEAKDPYVIPCIERMVRVQARHFELELTEENESLVKSFIVVGLRFDFYLEELDLQDPEFDFDHVEDSDVKYRMIGFIDKHAIKGDYARIVDYKTSKQKFSAEEIGFNIQSLMYMLAIKKKYPHLTRIDCDFLFLKFPQKPLQRVSLEGKVLEDSLRGVEEFLHYMNESLTGFDLDTATSNFAADDRDKKWLCGRKPEVWKCPYRNEVKYYVLVDKDGKTVTSDRDRSKLEERDGMTIKTKLYTGCPKYPWENKGK